MAEQQDATSKEGSEMQDEMQNSEKNEESGEEETDEEEYFEVERIMARKKRNGLFLYRVRWKGYPPSNDTWEPVDNLSVVLDMVQEYDAKEEQKAKARQEERHIRKLRMEGKKLPGEESSDDSSNSSDDERLLNEDTKFFKMLEKNKDIVFRQPDLYSKVKSRTATLASKKNNEESKEESTLSSSRSSRSQTEVKETNKGSGRGESKGKVIQSKVATDRNSNKLSKKAVNKDHEDEDSPESFTSQTRKKSARDRSRSLKQMISDSSEEDANSDNIPEKKKGAKGRGRPKKNLISESSEDTDSDDSLPLQKVSQRGRGKSKPKVLCDDSEDNDSDNCSPDKTSTEAAKSTSKKAVTKTPVKRKYTKKETKNVDATTEKESKKILLESELEKHVKIKSKLKSSTEEKNLVGGLPVIEPLLEQQDKGDQSKGENKANSSTSSVDSLKTSPIISSTDECKTLPMTSLTASLKTSPTTSGTDKCKTLTVMTSAQSRSIIPVLEKFAQSSSVHEGFLENPVLPKNEEENAVKKTVKEKETASDMEGLEMAPEKKQSGKGNKKKSLSRKRKKDTTEEHSKAVIEGEASPVKVAPPLPSSGLVDTESSPIDTNLLPAPVEVDCHEVNQDLKSGDKTPSAISPGMPKLDPEKKVPPLRITVPKLKIDSDLPKIKPESSKLHFHSPKLQDQPGKSEKQKSKGDSVKTNAANRDHILSTGVEKSNVKQARPSSRLPSKESVRSLPSSDVFTSSGPTVSNCSFAAALIKDLPVKTVGATSVSSHQHVAFKSEYISKPPRTEIIDSRNVKPEPFLSSTMKLDPTDKSGRSEQVDLKCVKSEQVDMKCVRSEAVDSRRKYSSSSKEFTSPTSAEDSKEGVFSSSSVRDMPNTSKDSSSRDSLCSFSNASSNRDTFSIYSGGRDSSIASRSPIVSSASSRDQSLSSLGCKDPHLSLGSGSGSSRDIHLASGYIHLSSGSSRDSSFSFSSSRDLLYCRDSKIGSAGVLRHGLNASISGKENADRQHTSKSLSSLPKKLDGVQPLDTILISSLYAGESDKSKQYKGLDADFEMALQRIDLEYLEKLLLPPVTPMELSDEELRQAVIDGNCYLVERALACTKPYNMDLPDNKGYTLLMNAVLRGSDDIIVHLLSRGADAQVQVNGCTALMLAVEHAECSTVFMLLEMGAHVNTADHNGETALFKAVRRGDKQILKLLLDQGSNFTLTSRAGLSPLQMAKQYRLADVETTLLDHIQRVVRAFEEQVNLTVRGTAKLVSCLFPHHCLPLYENDTITIPFKYQPTLPSGPGMGCLLFIAHARFSQQDVKCRLYGQCAVEKVTLNRVTQPCLTESDNLSMDIAESLFTSMRWPSAMGCNKNSYPWESNFVLMCHPLIAGWNELVIHTKKDPTSKAKLIVCAYKAQLIYQ